MLEILLALVVVAVMALAGALVYAARQVRVLIPCVADSALRTRELMTAIECLCTNLGGLREQIGQGGHGHG